MAAEREAMRARVVGIEFVNGAACARIQVEVIGDDWVFFRDRIGHNIVLTVADAAKDIGIGTFVDYFPSGIAGTVVRGLKVVGGPFDISGDRCWQLSDRPGLFSECWLLPSLGAK